MCYNGFKERRKENGMGNDGCYCWRSMGSCGALLGFFKMGRLRYDEKYVIMVLKKGENGNG